MPAARTPLLLLHGALGAASQFAPLLPLLEERFALHAPNFPGHGGEAISSEPFSIARFSEYLRSYIDEQGLRGADVFGYSMGGYVALHCALHAPGSLGRIMTLATKFDWNPDSASREAAMLDPDVVEAKVPKFAEQLRQRHAPANWRTVAERTAEMMVNLGSRNELSMADLAGVPNQVMIGIGDSDRMVSLEESIAAFRALPNGRFIALPATQHPLERVSPERLAREICEFLPDLNS